MSWALAAPIAALLLAAQAGASVAVRRPITIDDVMKLRHIDTLSVSPDGRRFALFVRQADPAANDYRTAWFAASSMGGPLTFVGDGGNAYPHIDESGHMTGDFVGPICRWSPDGLSISYLLERQGQTQVWRSHLDGSLQEQLTHSAADVRDFAWRKDGQVLYFSTGESRTQLQAEEKARIRNGYRYDDDLYGFTDFMLPQRPRPQALALAVRALMLDNGQERRTNQTERADFARLQNLNTQHPPPEIPHATEDVLQQCSAGPMDRWICLRQTPTRPSHVASIDGRSGEMQVIADVNPEFRDIELGRVERFEWDTPKFAWNEKGGALEELYPKRAHGYILYPAGYDAARRYPTFIDPYVADGFDSKFASEHALYVYAASGMVVLNTAFPVPTHAFERLGGATIKRLYSAELDFPHLSMLMESTVRALDIAAARGLVDERRVGIGGVSHGTFVPLYMLQKYDRIAAISISSPTWGPHEYYWATRKSREAVSLTYGASSYEEWRVKPQGAGLEFWNRIDIANHVDAIEAPILMNLAAAETYALLRLIRHMSDAGKPYDAYVFPDETHIKYQPAHLQAIYHRNLDWFRFWLQGYEDPQPNKAAQYAHWRQLRTSRR